MAIKIGSGGDSVKNIYVWVDEEIPYLCFTAVDANCNVLITKIGSPTTVTLETSTDGATRTTYTFGTQITLTNIGDKVYWRNTSTTTTGFSLGTSNYYRVASSGGNFAASGDVNYLLNRNSTTTVSNYCFTYLFYYCSGLTTPPKLPATTLGAYCYRNMFMQCPNLSALPKLSATTLGNYCYYQMFYGSTNIKLSTTKTGDYQTSYRIPTSGTGTSGNASLEQMFTSTGGTFKSTPTINTTYYTSNTVV